MAKTGLVLEGGGMRGIFVAGVLDFFLDKKITFDVCTAVSAGSCHACSYLSGQRGRALASGTKFLDDKRYCSMESFLRTGDLFGADFLYHKIPDELLPFDHAAFEANPTEFYAVVTDCETGEAVYPRLTDMHRDIDYIQASSSLPFVSRMVPVDGRLYLDGGLSDSIPLRYNESIGCTKNVVVLTREPEYRKGPNKTASLAKLRYHQYPALAEAMARRHEVYNETLDYIKLQKALGNVLVIQPQSPLPLGRIEKDPARLQAAYEEGYREAERMYESLLLYLQP